MNRFITDMLTGKDNSTYDFIRVAAFGVICTLIGLEIYETVVLQHDFNPIQLACAIGTVFAAAGAALWMKKDTEPQ